MSLSSSSITLPPTGTITLICAPLFQLHLLMTCRDYKLKFKQLHLRTLHAKNTLLLLTSFYYGSNRTLYLFLMNLPLCGLLQWLLHMHPTLLMANYLTYNFLLSWASSQLSDPKPKESLFLDSLESDHFN